MKQHFVARFLEFFVVGLIFGIAEDILAIMIATEAKFSWDMLWIVALIALPFAIFSELIVDGKFLLPLFKKKMKEEEKVIAKDIVAIEKAVGFKKKKKR